jgi:[acyl-carrier-protein] S-malonyltransferase
MTRTALLFPGQGAQSVGMGRAAYESSDQVRELFDRANDVLGYDLAELCFLGPAERLDSTVVSQPALFVTSLAALELLRQQTPDAIANCVAAAGLSLGEYTALVFAGAIDFESGLRVVQTRGQAMQAASDAARSGMASILGLEVPQIERLCEEARQGQVLQVANLLCPGNTVVSGDSAALDRVAELASAAGAMKVIRLSVAGAFHTPLMQPAVDRLAAALSEVALVQPRLPVISNVDAQPHNDPKEIRELLVKQVESPVLWEASLRRLLAMDVAQFHEVGPGRVLAGLLKRIDRKIPCASLTV